MKTKLKMSLILLTILFATTIILNTRHGECSVLFEDNFDSRPDWSPPQPAYGSNATLTCVLGNTCSYALPSGYNDYRLAAAESCSNTDGSHNTMNINGNYPRGGTGKSFQMWSEPCLSSGGSWGSDGLLGVAVMPQTELYVRYYIRFQPNWVWWKNGVNSPMQKFLHISHYNLNDPASLWDFMSGTQNKPRFTPQLAKWGGGIYRTQFSLPHSPLTTARNSSASYAINVDVGPDPQDWSNTNAPGDGQWHSFEFHVKLNSYGGATDGVSEVWYDGNLVHAKKDVVWIPAGDTPDLWKWNHVWIGGNSYNLYTPQAEQWYAIDDLVISTHYSGPPPAPKNMVAISQSNSPTTLQWSAGSNGSNFSQNGYKIYYGTDANNLSNVITVGNVNSYAVTSLPTGSYYFSVSAYNKSEYDTNENESLRSNVTSASVTKTSDDPPAGIAPPPNTLSAPSIKDITPK